MNATGPLMRGVIASAILLATSGAASAERRALVIGNNDYADVARLQKAVGDARAMKQALEQLKFKVTLVENVDYRGFGDAIDAFESKITPGDEIVVHYSGHGVAMGGLNYLLPTDIEDPQPGQERRVQRTSYEAGQIVESFRAKQPRYVFAVLDACRNNPFKGAGRSVALTRGLTRMEAEPGAFLLFSAGPGETALDRLSDTDAAVTSVFTRILVKQLETPGMSLQEIAKTTQQKVRDLALSVDHRQFPDYSDRTTEEPVLLPGTRPAAPDVARPDAGAETAFRLAMIDGSEAALKAVIGRFPDHPRAKDARERLAARADDAAFAKAREAGTAAAYKTYLATPGGRHAADARTALASLEPAAAAPDAAPQLPSSGPDANLKPLAALIGPQGTQQIYSAVMAPDGGSIAVTLEDSRKILFWNLADGTVRASEEHPGDLYALAFSPDGRLLASAGADNNVRLWDVATGANLKTLEGSEIPPRAVGFSPDGRLVGAADGKLRLWSVESGELDRTIDGGFSTVKRFAWSPDGRTIAGVGNDRIIRLWDPETGDRLQETEKQANEIDILAFTPDGSALVSHGQMQGTQVWDPEAATLRQTIANKNFSLAISPDSRWIASGAREALALFDLASGKPGRKFQAMNGRLSSDAAFSPDGRLLMSSAYPRSVGVWDAGTGRLVSRLVLLPEGEWVITGDKGYAVSPEGHGHLRLEGRTGAFQVDDAFRKRWLKDSLPVLAGR